MAAVVVGLCLIALYWWFRMRANETRKKIIGCTHEHVSVESVYSEGRFLYLQCEDCPLQIHLRSLVPLPPRDTFWYTRNREEYGLDHMMAIEELREMDREDFGDSGSGTAVLPADGEEGTPPAGDSEEQVSER